MYVYYMHVHIIRVYTSAMCTYMYIHVVYLQVPLGLIDAVEMYGSKEQVVVLCKDGGRFW